jgi:hypothetical protein
VVVGEAGLMVGHQYVAHRRQPFRVIVELQPGNQLARRWYGMSLSNLFVPTGFGLGRKDVYGRRLPETLNTSSVYTSIPQFVLQDTIMWSSCMISLAGITLGSER